MSSGGGQTCPGSGRLTYSSSSRRSDPSRQLDLIKANIAGFTGMILLEHLTWVCIAIACVAAAVRVRHRGAWPATVGATLAVVGAAGSLGDFGSALPALARLDDRSAAVWFVHHLGPVYNVGSALGAGTLIGLLLMFVGLWRAGASPVAAPSGNSPPSRCSRWRCRRSPACCSGPRALWRDRPGTA